MSEFFQTVHWSVQKQTQHHKVIAAGWNDKQHP